MVLGVDLTMLVLEIRRRMPVIGRLMLAIVGFSAIQKFDYPSSRQPSC